MIGMLLMNDIRADLDLWEHTVLWMYLDSEGLVTVGCGTMLPTAASATEIPFVHDKTLRPATIPEIDAAWRELALGHTTQKAAAPAHKYGYRHFQTRSDLRITQETAGIYRDQHVEADYRQLQQIYATFDSFPDDAKLALFDMIYNLGPGRGKSRHHRASGLRAYAHMNAAINAGNWAVAAGACLRHGIPPGRNRMTAQLFQNCASADQTLPFRARLP